MHNYIIVDVTGLVTFITATSAQQALVIATQMGYKPFIVREV